MRNDWRGRFCASAHERLPSEGQLNAEEGSADVSMAIAEKGSADVLMRLQRLPFAGRLIRENLRMCSQSIAQEGSADALTRVQRQAGCSMPGPGAFSTPADADA